MAEAVHLTSSFWLFNANIMTIRPPRDHALKATTRRIIPRMQVRNMSNHIRLRNPGCSTRRRQCWLLLGAMATQLLIPVIILEIVTNKGC